MSPYETPLPISVPAAQPPVHFGHVNLPVSDIERSASFYGTWFGLRRGPEFRDESGRLTGLFLYLSRGVFIELFASDELTPWQGHVCFEVPGIARFVEHLRHAGITVSGPCLGRSKAWMAFLADPDGHRIELNDFSHADSWIGRYLVRNDPGWIPGTFVQRGPEHPQAQAVPT